MIDRRQAKLYHRTKCLFSRRFISEDPARDGLNWYAYAAGNPINFVDPLGLLIEDSYDAFRGAMLSGNANATGRLAIERDNIVGLESHSEVNGIVKDVTNPIMPVFRPFYSKETIRYMNNKFRTENKRAVDRLSQIMRAQKAWKETNWRLNHLDENHRLSMLLRSFRGASYGPLRMPTLSEMDCSGMLVLGLDMMGYQVDKNLRAIEMASGNVPWIKLVPLDKDRQGEEGKMNFYIWKGDNVVSHVNYGVGKLDFAESENQIMDASESGTVWEPGRNSQGVRQFPNAFAGFINKTWAPFSSSTDPVYQAVIDWDKLELKE